MKNQIKAVAAVLLSSSSGAAFAAHSTTSFPVSATVLNVCTVAALPLVFGNYDPTASVDTDGSTTVAVLCTLGQAYTIRLSQGMNGNDVTARKMIQTGGSELLSYALFRDASRSLNWGITDAADTVAASGTGLTQNHTVYGRIPAGSSVPAGVYTDVVTVTVNY